MNIDQSRNKIINDFVKNDYSLSIGAGNTCFGTINIDKYKTQYIDIIASALYLPFRKNSFKTIIFTEVIEHIPKHTELRSLKEIKRVMKDKLIITTPHDVPLYTYLDPAKYQVSHRHYKLSFINKLMKDAEFTNYRIYCKGNTWALIYLLYRYIIYFRINRLFNPKIDVTPKWLIKKVNDSYKSIGNYTIYVLVENLQNGSTN